MKEEQEIQSLVQENKELNRKLLESESKNKELIEENELLKLQLNDDMDLPYIDMKPISRKKYKLTEIKANKK